MKMMPKKRKLVVALFIVILIYGVAMITLPHVPVYGLSAREAQLTEAVLRSIPVADDSRIYFLTPTPRTRWGDRGHWARFSDHFHARIKDLPIKYRPASGAYLLGGSVRSRISHQRAWLQWVSIIRWNSDTEAVVEEGIWSCPLGGGASTCVWERVDGVWRRKEDIGGWISHSLRTGLIIGCRGAAASVR